ncbi:MAG: hypothetical protein KC461_00490 [Dehalococcoidia bacterium]|nr:hypothetical protein [Dehalococcoidia bacterium]MCA9849113.1 hypothetical protein [Dehalococcoidia bacterium]MCA9857148.1 hypothetical protein [Dehalococcoidia bacterium]MCB9483317.1 hypothetical protein [Dehalococcoidia bacterium]
MGCPVHIWVPLMGAAAPFARVARDRVRGMMPSKPAAEEKPREMKRWAPVGQPPVERSEANS